MGLATLVHGSTFSASQFSLSCIFSEFAGFKTFAQLFVALLPVFARFLTGALANTFLPVFARFLPDLLTGALANTFLSVFAFLCQTF